MVGVALVEAIQLRIQLWQIRCTGRWTWRARLANLYVQLYCPPFHTETGQKEREETERSGYIVIGK